MVGGKLITYKCVFSSTVALFFLASNGMMLANAATTAEICGNSDNPSPTCIDIDDGNGNVKFSRENVLEWILAKDYSILDTALDDSIDALKSRGAHRCWHKHSTFLEHLVGVHDILRLWGQSELVGRVGLFHSAYSNSYVNLALWDPLQERHELQKLIGMDAEEMVHMFCIINRQEIVVHTLLKDGKIPEDGMTVPHLRDPDRTVYLSPKVLQMLVIFTMADIADQYFGWQDEMFGGNENFEHSMLLPLADHPSNHKADAIWPGISKPGLWMSYLNSLSQVAKTYSGNNDDDDDDQPLPPIFDNCSKILTRQDEATARDMYWQVISDPELTRAKQLELLQSCHEYNPWAFEPLVIQAQLLLVESKFDQALDAATRALNLQHMWGTAWDKRLSFNAWIAWTRVLKQRAEARQAWPTNSWDVNNFGLVK